jgi:ketosteroid isomerase-like protein
MGIRQTGGKLFQEKHIVDILQNEAYIGNIVYGKTRYNYVEDEEKNKKIQQVVYLDEKDWVRKENAHPAIIEKELFEMAKKRIQENKQLHPHPKQFNAAKHPLTGLLKCGKCGANMICQKRTNKKKDGTKLEYRYYVCSTYHKKGRNVCSQANVNADHLEDDILAFIETKIAQYVDYTNTSGVKEKEEQKQGLLKDLNQIENLLKKKMNASKALLESRVDYDIETFVELNKAFQDDIKKLRGQKEIIEESFLELNDQNSHLEIMELAQELKEHKQMDLEYKRRVFHKLLESVVFQDNEVKEINFYSSLKL